MGGGKAVQVQSEQLPDAGNAVVDRVAVNVQIGSGGLHAAVGFEIGQQGGDIVGVLGGVILIDLIDLPGTVVDQLTAGDLLENIIDLDLIIERIGLGLVDEILAVAGGTERLIPVGGEVVEIADGIADAAEELLGTEVAVQVRSIAGARSGRKSRSEAGSPAPGR